MKSFIDMCIEIGCIAETSSLYTEGLERRLKDTGKNFEDLTIKELLQINQAYKAWFNKIYSI